MAKKPSTLVETLAAIPARVWNPLPRVDEAIGGFKGLHEDLSPSARPLGVLSKLSNLHIRPAPALSTRPGLTLVGAAGAGVVNGIHVFRKLDGTTQLLRHVGTILERWTGTAWTSAGTGLPDAPSTSANLTDKLCIFTGSAAKSWNGTTLTNLTGAPAGRYAVQAYEQLFVAGIGTREGDLDYCDVALPTTWSPSPVNDAGSHPISAYPIRWVGFDKVQGKVIVWTTRSVELFLGPETPNRPQLWSVRTVAQEGTPNGRTVQHVNGAWVWLTDDAFVVWGGSMEKVYLPIKQSFALIDWANIARAGSWVTQDGQYVCQVPKIGGGTIWFTWDPATGWYTDTGADIRSSGMFDFGAQQQTVLGDATGNTYTAGGTDDAGTAIAWSVDIGPVTLGDAFNKKQLLQVCAVGHKAAGATVAAALSTTAEGEDFGPAKVINFGAGFNQTPIPLPFNPEEFRRSGVFRLRLSGTGPVELDDLRLRFAKGRV